ncbi:hypothetical protein NQU59_11630 [Acinetobacter colistiniresistens]|uniref:hypothetical protein n=1 Tax=Acinetobacter colistiniresistens TaxID=280145 RepID=UPI00211BB3BB|nr:hypothetical protein [Acinetobacter colistiniresistens]UUM26351.1 hypothetical protein NQU59_11630 [Acinetobacter colistiniresistens]
MATLPKKMTAVFEKYEAMNPNSWKMGDFEQDIIAISRQPANYQDAKSAIRRAQKAGRYPITTSAYVQKHIDLFGNAP